MCWRVGWRGAHGGRVPVAGAFWFAVVVRSHGFVPRLSVVSITALAVAWGLRIWLRVCYCCVCQ